MAITAEGMNITRVQRLQEETLGAFGHVIKNTFIDDDTSPVKVGSPAVRRVRSLPASCGRRASTERVEAPFVVNLSEWRPSRVSTGRSGRSGCLKLPIGRSRSGIKDMKEPSPSACSKGEVSPFSSLLADFGDCRSREVSPTSTSCGSSSGWESSDGSFTITTPTISHLTSSSTVDSLVLPTTPRPHVEETQEQFHFGMKSEPVISLRAVGKRQIGDATRGNTATATVTATQTPATEDDESLATLIERDCSFLKIAGRDYYDEQNQLRRKRGVVKSLVFFIKGLPWAKRARWLMPLLWSVSSVLKARGCGTRVQAGELYVQLPGMCSEEFVRVDFAAAR